MSEQGLEQYMSKRHVDYDLHLGTKVKRLEESVKALLLEHPIYRNLDDTEFMFKFWQYHLDFKTGDMLTVNMQKRIKRDGNPQTISRCLRKLREPEYARIKELLKMLIQVRVVSEEQFKANLKTIQAELDQCQFMPTDVDLVLNKYVKEKTMRDIMIAAKERSEHGRQEELSSANE